MLTNVIFFSQIVKLNIFVKKKINWQCRWLIIKLKYCSNVQFVLFWSMNLDVQWEDRWKPYVVLICDPKHVRFSSMFSLGIKTHAHNEISHFLLSFRNNFYPKCTICVFISEFYRKCVTFLAHQFPSFILTFWDVWLMNSLNCSSTEQTYKNVPQDLKLWKYWPTSSTGMKPSFGSWNLLPWFGSKVVSLCKDIRMVFKWGLPNKTKVIITSHKIYK